MKTLLTIILIANAASAGSTKSTAQKVAQNGPRLSTDVRFDGQVVGGKIQNPLEALSVVENEKSIDDLIGVRKNFFDRSEKSKGLR